MGFVSLHGSDILPWGKTHLKMLPEKSLLELRDALCSRREKQPALGQVTIPELLCEPLLCSRVGELTLPPGEHPVMGTKVKRKNVYFVSLPRLSTALRCLYSSFVFLLFFFLSIPGLTCDMLF